ALRESGIGVTRSVDRFPRDDAECVYVFVPHEFMPLVHPEAQPEYDQLQRSIAICTEQPGTQWFARAVEVAARVGIAIDINPLGVAALQQRGVNARLLRLGYVPAWDRWGGDAASARPIDAVFQGGHTVRRARALAGCGPA